MKNEQQLILSIDGSPNGRASPQVFVEGPGFIEDRKGTIIRNEPNEMNQTLIDRKPFLVITRERIEERYRCKVRVQLGRCLSPKFRKGTTLTTASYKQR